MDSPAVRRGPQKELRVTGEAETDWDVGKIDCIVEKAGSPGRCTGEHDVAEQAEPHTDWIIRLNIEGR